MALLDMPERRTSPGRLSRRRKAAAAEEEAARNSAAIAARAVQGSVSSDDTTDYVAETLREILTRGWGRDPLEPGRL